MLWFEVMVPSGPLRFHKQCWQKLLLIINQQIILINFQLQITSCDSWNSFQLFTRRWTAWWWIWGRLSVTGDARSLLGSLGFINMFCKSSMNEWTIKFFLLILQWTLLYSLSSRNTRTALQPRHKAKHSHLWPSEENYKYLRSIEKLSHQTLKGSEALNKVLCLSFDYYSPMNWNEQAIE